MARVELALTSLAWRGPGLLLKRPRDRVDTLAVSDGTHPHAPHIGTAEHFRWLDGVIKVVLALNLLDALFTIAWVTLGVAREANPLLEHLVRDHPVLFTAVKLGLVGGASWLLWQHRTRPLAVVGIFAGFLVYYGLLLWHVGYLSLIVGTLLFP